jgi:microcystin-dependent protein
LTRRANHAQIHIIATIIEPAPQERQRVFHFYAAMFARSVSGFAAFSLKFDTSGKYLRSAPNADLLAGVLIEGTPYVAVYNNADGAFYLQSFYGNPYNVPIGAGMDFWGGTAPNSSFVFPFGQAVSRTVYATYFVMVSTTFGAGDGSTTFNLPDLRGRVTARPDNMGGGDAGRLSGSALSSVRFSVGGAGGEGMVALSTSNLPPYTPSGNIVNGAISSSTGASGAGGGGTGLAGGPGNQFISIPISSTQGPSTFVGLPQGGTSTPHDNMQPTILSNCIMRII